MQWQAHWLELRILALKQQQQRYELRLQKLQQQQDAQDPVLPSSWPPADTPPEGPRQAAHQQAQPSLPVAPQPPDSLQQLAAPAAPADQATLPAAAQQAQPHIGQGPAAGDGISLVTEQSHRQQQQAVAVTEPMYKHRHARQPVPGLSMPEIARHPFFCRHSDAHYLTVEQPAAQGESLCGDDATLLKVKHASLEYRLFRAGLGILVSNELPCTHRS